MHGKAQKNKAATSSEPIEVEEVDVDVVLVARTFSSADSETLEKGFCHSSCILWLYALACPGALSETDLDRIPNVRLNSQRASPILG